MYIPLRPFSSAVRRVVKMPSSAVVSWHRRTFSHKLTRDSAANSKLQPAKKEPRVWDCMGWGWVMGGSAKIRGPIKKNNHTGPPLRRDGGNASVAFVGPKWGESEGARKIVQFHVQYIHSGLLSTSLNLNLFIRQMRSISHHSVGMWLLKYCHANSFMTWPFTIPAEHMLQYCCNCTYCTALYRFLPHALPDRGSRIRGASRVGEVYEGCKGKLVHWGGVKSWFHGFMVTLLYCPGFTVLHCNALQCADCDCKNQITALGGKSIR